MTEWWKANAVCLECHHEWLAICPNNYPTLECPECHKMRGVTIRVLCDMYWDEVGKRQELQNLRVETTPLRNRIEGLITERDKFVNLAEESRVHFAELDGKIVAITRVLTDKTLELNEEHHALVEARLALRDAQTRVDELMSDKILLQAEIRELKGFVE